ncbi:hypothetical protein BDV25DRAFT_149053 [Aspergillus avenaceus]|uniref:Uncharacterized protein n=1 Tax=Aspergillus avenaceus TaxID=36643 RepID=A0A5N6U5B8_ASPAV|nr:hypothetical protein BDV25DRAFT_149053 [Aspergillus avenaceus]
MRLAGVGQVGGPVLRPCGHIPCIHGGLLVRCETAVGGSVLREVRRSFIAGTEIMQQDSTRVAVHQGMRDFQVQSKLLVADLIRAKTQRRFIFARSKGRDGTSLPGRRTDDNTRGDSIWLQDQLVKLARSVMALDKCCPENCVAADQFSPRIDNPLCCRSPTIG